MTSERMPAEWEPHRATWIAWPFLESDFPGKIDAVRWAYCELIRHLCREEWVEVLCCTNEMKSDLETRLSRQNISGDIRIHIAQYDRSWLRDSGPIGVLGNTPQWKSFAFTGWSVLGGFERDQGVPQFISDVTGLPNNPVVINNKRVVFEGGMIDVNGDGSILATEECLLSQNQERNPGFQRKDYEQLFHDSFGAHETIWLPFGLVGDDTHGHIDNVARFVKSRTVVVASAPVHDTEQFNRTEKNIEALTAFRTRSGDALEVIRLPLPEPRYCDGDRFAAGYANFYIANNLVLVPTYNDPQDRVALGILSDLFPERKVIGINCTDWILGGGTLHCSTQQEPLLMGSHQT
jgi:agmatine deiminase